MYVPHTCHNRGAYVMQNIMYNNYGGINMSKFKIPVIPSTTHRSIRFPNDLIEDVENAIQGKQSTFSAFVVAATRHALNELKDTDNLITK